MATKAKPPILPSNPADPAGVDKLERGAMRNFDRRMRRVRQAYVEALDRIPAEPVVNRKYVFRLDALLITHLLAQLDMEVDSILLEGGENGLWFFDQYVEVAAVRGTAQAFANLGQQSPAYKSGRESLQNILRSEPYRLRMALVRARVFEEMKGLSNQVKADMARILTDGIGRGLNPRQVARNLRDQSGIEARRAHRIARTEITTALRRARWDEAEEAQELYGLKTKLMHLSALSPTTRATHAARHARLYTVEQVRDWYSQDGNSINCYLPGTQVSGRFVAGSKAQYRGPIVEIVTAAGRSLTVTPNHPILTAQGMIPAAEVRKGDYAIAYGGEVEDSARVGLLNDQKIHSSIEDVFGSLVQLGHSFTRGVVAVDFHGDAAGMNVDVDVVSIEGILPINCDASLNEVLDHVSFVLADSNGPHVGSSLSLDFSGVFLAAASLIGRFGDRIAKLLRRLRVLNPCSVGIGPLPQAVFFKSSGNRDPGKTNFFADLLHGFPLHVFGKKKADVVSRFEGSSVGGNSGPTDVIPDGVRADAVLLGKRWGASTGLVFADEVIDVRLAEYDGHVYDLQEVSGLMLANGIIASNCKCSQTEVMVDDDGNPVVPGIVARAKQTKQKMEDRGYAWSKD